MADNQATTVSAAPAENKAKNAIVAVKKLRAGASHPPSSEMVNVAIKALNERTGSSLYAIKKYIAANYDADVEKLSTFIKKYVKSAVIAGNLIQTKGIGASGSFKLAASPKKKATAPKKPKTKGGEKDPKGKETAAKKKTASKPKAEKPAKATKSPKEKSTKVAAKGPKSPKPKKMASPAKKVAAAAPKKN